MAGCASGRRPGASPRARGRPAPALRRPSAPPPPPALSSVKRARRLRRAGGLRSCPALRRPSPPTSLRREMKRGGGTKFRAGRRRAGLPGILGGDEGGGLAEDEAARLARAVRSALEDVVSRPGGRDRDVVGALSARREVDAEVAPPGDARAQMGVGFLVWGACPAGQHDRGLHRLMAVVLYSHSGIVE